MVYDVELLNTPVQWGLGVLLGSHQVQSQVRTRLRGCFSEQEGKVGKGGFRGRKSW